MRRFTTGLVLAADGSSRLGRPKQLLDVHGRTLLEATLDTWADDERLLEST